MLTPAYSPTATERVLPRLALDFTTASLDPRVTVARALNTATRVNASGLIETVNADLPRFDFNPVTLTCRGLLIEETRANLCAYSAAVGGTGWTLESGVTVSGTTTAPDGSSANTISCTNAVSGVYKQISSLGAATYTVSFYVKAGTSTSIAVGLVNVGYFVAVNLTTGAILGGLGASRTTVANAGNDWWRVSVYNVCSAGNFGPLIVSNTANTTFSVWGAQFEIGEFATSYIPTTSTSLTRNADNVGMTGTNFSSWYNASAGTIGLEFDLLATTAAPGGVIAMITAGAQNGYGFYKSGLSDAFFTLVGATFTSTGTVVTNTVQKTILGYDATDIRSILNRGSLATIATASIGSPAAMYLGRNWYAGDFMSGHMRKVSYWPQKLTDAEITANTY